MGFLLANQGVSGFIKGRFHINHFFKFHVMNNKLFFIPKISLNYRKSILKSLKFLFFKPYFTSNFSNL